MVPSTKSVGEEMLTIKKYDERRKDARIADMRP
jgi:hypothetical protein